MGYVFKAKMDNLFKFTKRNSFAPEWLNGLMHRELNQEDVCIKTQAENIMNGNFTKTFSARGIFFWWNKQYWWQKCIVFIVDYKQERQRIDYLLLLWKKGISPHKWKIPREFGLCSGSLLNLINSTKVTHWFNWI